MNPAVILWITAQEMLSSLETEFNNAIKQTPKHPQSYGNIGIYYMITGRKQEALHAFKKAIELDPFYEPARVNRKIAASLKEIETIDYYKDYPRKKNHTLKKWLIPKGVCLKNRLNRVAGELPGYRTIPQGKSNLTAPLFCHF